MVGGCVRDTLLLGKVSDIDLATTLRPEDCISLFNKKNIKVINTGIKHGTVTILINKKSFEMTTLRKDIKCDGRHAKVLFTNDWHVDAARRDFTFNALYADIDGYIYDYFDGIKDLNIDSNIMHIEKITDFKYKVQKITENINKINNINIQPKIKFVNNINDRIKEDYLRILRVFRFHAKICPQSDIHLEILEECKKNKENISIISGERIQQEMFKLLSFHNKNKTLLYMSQCGILQKIKLILNNNQDNFIQQFINYNTDIIIPEWTALNPIVELAVLLYKTKQNDISPQLQLINYKKIIDNIKGRWALSNKNYHVCKFLILTYGNMMASYDSITQHCKYCDILSFYDIVHYYIVHGTIISAHKNKIETSNLYNYYLYYLRINDATYKDFVILKKIYSATHNISTKTTDNIQISQLMKSKKSICKAIEIAYWIELINETKDDTSSTNNIYKAIQFYQNENQLALICNILRISNMLINVFDISNNNTKIVISDDFRKKIIGYISVEIKSIFISCDKHNICKIDEIITQQIESLAQFLPTVFTTSIINKITNSIMLIKFNL